MKHIYNTTSICEQCLKHIDAKVVEENDKIWIYKNCKCSDDKKYLIEDNADFFHSLKYNKLHEYSFNVLLIEVTDKCNLKCPHCYHLPDNRKKDKSIESIIDQLKQAPATIDTFILAGAEPTARKDLDILIKRINLQFPDKRILLLTNGVKLDNLDYVKVLKNSGLFGVMIGLNHRTYQGSKIRNKQIRGIINCRDLNLAISYIGYTLESYDHLEDTIKESQTLVKQGAAMIRIRMGSDIGRSPGEGHKTLSQLYYNIEKTANKLNLPFKVMEADNNIYHIMVKVGNAPIRIIQWPDIKNIVMEELKTGPWCQFYDGPITNFVHQVITRDLIINQGYNIDTCDSKYHYKL
jgi:hypothetical protein